MASTQKCNQPTGSSGGRHTAGAGDGRAEDGRAAARPYVALDHVNVDLNGTRILHDITWALLPGQHWAVLGQNGAGKSTFLRLIRGEIWPAPVDGGRRVYGFDGESTESPIGIKQKIALVSAEQQTRYMRTEWHMLCWQVVFTGLFDSDLMYHHPTDAQLATVRATLTELGIAALWDSPFQKLSQGQLRKVLIARALVRKPPVLICDEIGVGLDRASRHVLFDAVERAMAHHTQVLMTSHRRDELLQAIQQHLELRDGRVVNNASPVTGASIARASGMPGPSRTSPATPLLEIKNADVALDEGATVILRNVNWRMNAGEHWMLLGDNGAGKSTLIKLILGELWPAHGGSIVRFDTPNFNDIREIKRQIGYVSHELQTRYHQDLSALQVVGTGFSASIGWLSTLTSEQTEQCHAVLRALGIAQLAERSIQRMSYGQVRKVLVARALVHKPRLLILDEVFDGLDAHFRADLASLFEDMAAQGVGLILVSHHDVDRLPCITHTLTIQDGRVLLPAA